MSAAQRRVLVTGAAGFVGRFMVNALLERGFAVTGLGQEVRPAEFPAAADWYRADLLATDSLQTLAKAWFGVVHLAGNTVPSAFRQADSALANVSMTLTLLEHLKSGRVLLASSALVYGPSATRHSEDETLEPQGYYGLSKYLCEQLAKVYSRQLEILIARPFNHIGPGMQPGLAIPAILDRVAIAMTNPGPIEMLGRDSVRDFVDVRDVVAAYLALLELPDPAQRVFNVCTGHGRSIREVVETALAIAGLERDVRFAEAALSGDDTSVVVGDSSRLRQAAGWRPRYDLEQSLRDMLPGAGVTRSQRSSV